MLKRKKREKLYEWYFSVQYTNNGSNISSFNFTDMFVRMPIKKNKLNQVIIDAVKLNFMKEHKVDNVVILNIRYLGKYKKEKNDKE